MKRDRGFTLAELLIVVTIVAVLVAIAIPVFISSLGKSREATDLANVRAKYAEVVTTVQLGGASTDSGIAITTVSGKKVYSAKVDLSQQEDGWATDPPIEVGGVNSESDSGTYWLNSPKANGQCLIKFTEGDTKPVLDWAGYADSLAVQAEKQAVQAKSSSLMIELKDKLLQKGTTAATKAHLDTLTSGAYYTLSDGTIAYYKKSASEIDTMKKDHSTDNKSWINFTLNDDGEIIMYNYVTPEYSYSSYDASAANSEWIGSAVIK